MQNKICGGDKKNLITTRFNQNKYNITKQQNQHLLVIKHFIEHGWEAIQATILENNPFWTTIQRRKIERKWIKQLKTITPFGLNEKTIT